MTADGTADGGDVFRRRKDDGDVISRFCVLCRRNVYILTRGRRKIRTGRWRRRRREHVGWIDDPGVTDSRRGVVQHDERDVRTQRMSGRLKPIRC